MDAPRASQTLIFVEGDVNSGLPFDDGEIHGAAVQQCLSPAFANQREAIVEFARVLAPGGRIVVADANRRQPLVFALDLVLALDTEEPRWASAVPDG